MIRYCVRCGSKFKTWKRRDRYCSPTCDDLDRRRVVDVDRLKQLAFSGATKTSIARELGVSYSTLKRVFNEYGLNEMWKEQRYA